MAARKRKAPAPTGIVGRRDTHRGRFYDIATGEAYPSVTTVLEVLAKPALIGWAARTERAAVLEAIRMVQQEVGETFAGPMDGALLAQMVDERMGDAKAHVRKLREAADIGTQVHKRIEWDILRLMKSEKAAEPQLTHPKAEESWRKYVAWRDSVRMEPIASEFQIVSHVHKYAGTADLKLRIWPDPSDPIWNVVLGPRNEGRETGLIVLADFKTGKGVYGEMFLQNGAYRLAEREMGLEPVSDAGLIIRLPKEVDDPEFEVVPVPPLEETIPGFLSARALYNWKKKDDEAYWAKRKAQEEEEKEAA